MAILPTVRVVCLTWVLACAGFSHAEELVGDYGDFARLQLHGLARLDPERVRQGLQNDFQLCLAAHPLAKLDDLPGAVRKRLLAGLQHIGYAEAEVKVEIDRNAGCLRIDVLEGPPYLCGAVEVEGVDAELRQRVIRRLTEPFPPPKAIKSIPVQVDGEETIRWLDRQGNEVTLSKPVWRVGDPAPLAETDGMSLERKIGETLGTLGFRTAKFRSTKEVDQVGQRVCLRVLVEEVGAVDRVDRIEIVGNERNSDETILKYLQLQTGEALVQELLTRLECELWRSGRFASVNVTATPQKKGPGPLGVKMELVESKYAPLLDQPLTREAELLLKTGRMLSRTTEWPSELLLRITTSNGVHDLVLHPQRGVLASKRTKDGELRLALAASLDALGYYSTHLPTKFECPPPSAWLTLKMEYSLNAQGQDDERPFIVSFAPGVESERPEHSNLPFGVQLNVEPAAIVALAALPGTRSTWTDDRLTLDNNHGHLAVDARDGRLLSYESSRDGIHLAVEHRPGAYEEQWKEICEGTQHQPNTFDAQRPYSSTLAFLYQEEVVYDLLDTIDSETDWRKRLQGDVEALRVARRLVELGMFERMDQLEVARKSGAEFRIPSVADETSQPMQWLPLIARVAVPWADELFPRKSWLWTVWRETCFVVAGQTEYTGPQLQALYGSSDIGPVGCLVISSLTSRVNADLAERFAIRGLWRCEVEEFRKDYAPLLNRHYAVGACLHRTAQVMRELTEDECSQLASSIAAEYRPALLQFAARLRESRDRPVEDTLPSALDEAWEAGLRDLVKAGLTRAQPKGAFRVTHAPSSNRVD